MKNSYLPPLIALAAIMTFSVWNVYHMDAQTQRWQAQLRQADQLVQTEDWPGIERALSASYDDWNSHQTYLHIVTQHDVVDDAEAMYRRAQAFAAAREASELRAELSDLIDQLRLLSEMERCSIRNVL